MLLVEEDEVGEDGFNILLYLSRASQDQVQAVVAAAQQPTPVRRAAPAAQGSSSSHTNSIDIQRG